MIIRVFVSYILFTLIAVSCNVSNQESVDARTSASISDTTFSYSNATNVLIEDTTVINIIPLLNSTATYSIEPDLPAGLSIAPGSGVISGIATASQAQTLYVIKAQTPNGNEYAQITIEVTGEPVKTLAYSQSNLVFTKDTAGTSYTATTTGGTPTSFTVNTALPTGLALNPLTGQISGTPTNSGASFYEITASNSSGEVTIQVLIDVKDAAPTGLTYNNDGQTINKNAALTNMQATLTSSPDAVTYTISPSLPAGLTINSASGEISGTPTVAPANTSYTVTATNETGSTTQTITITINDPPTYLAYNVAGVPEYDSGTLVWQKDVTIANLYISSYQGGAVTGYACNPACPAGLSVSANGVISGTPTAYGSGSFTITATNGAGSIDSAPITYKVVEDFPEDYNNLGYASEYTIYVDHTNPISISPAALPGGNATQYKLADESYGQLSAGPPVLFNTPITNLHINYGQSPFDSTDGRIYTDLADELTGAVDVTLVIEGYNLDSDGVSYVKTGEQQVRIKVEVMAPTRLGYTGTGGAVTIASEFNATSQVLELTEGKDLVANIDPSVAATGGTPTTYSILPQLPNGLNFAPTTGIISGKPTENTPITYYTITGTNDGGSYTETIAISTNKRIAPESFEYASPNPTTHYGDLTFELFTYQEEACTYVGSSGTFTISPALPLGLNIHPVTGMIYGTPLASIAGPTMFNVTITNELGSLTQPVQIEVENTVATSGLAYTDQYSNTTPSDLYVYIGDTISNTDITHTSNYDPANPGTSAGFIEEYSETSGGAGLGASALKLDTTTGDITTDTGLSVSAANQREGSLTQLKTNIGQVSIEYWNDFNSATPASLSFYLLPIEKAPVISYDHGYGNNIVVVKGDARGSGSNESDDYSQFFNVSNTGGLVAATWDGGAVDGNVSGEGCYVSARSTTNYDIDDEYLDYYDSDSDNTNSGATTYNAGVNFSFEVTNCSFRFNANTCFHTDNTGLGEESQTYTITAKNSGTEVSGTNATANISVYLVDGPNFSFKPETDGTYFNDAKILNLDGSMTITGELSYTPDTTNMCHKGDFNLTDLSDLPSMIPPPSSTDGKLEVNSQVLMGRANFTLSASRTLTNPAMTLSQTESIQVQASHIEDTSVVANGWPVALGSSRLLEVKKVDVNGDGYKDVIVRGRGCDYSTACATNNTSIYIQDTVSVGIFDGIDEAGHAELITGNSGLKHITGITYASGKGGVLALNSNRDYVFAASLSDEESWTSTDVLDDNNLTFASAGQGIVPMETGIVTDFGVFLHQGSVIYIDQFEIVNEKLIEHDGTDGIQTSTTTALVTISNASVNNVKFVTYFDMDADGYNEAVVVYDEDGTTGGDKICIIPSDGSTFNSSCKAIYGVTSTETITKIVFKDVVGDSLPDLIYMAYDSSGSGSNTVVVMENRSAVTTPGDFNTVDSINMVSGSPYVNFDIADVNNDGYADLVANDRVYDFGSDSVADGPAVTGYSIYYHTNTSDIYQSSFVTYDDDGFFYHNSSGHAYNTEILESAGGRVLMNCSYNPGGLTASSGATIPSTETYTSCGIIGQF